MNTSTDRRSSELLRSAGALGVELLEPRIVLDGDWSAAGDAGVFASVADSGLAVTTISVDHHPIVFEQSDSEAGLGSDIWEQIAMLRTADGKSDGINFDTYGRHSLAIRGDRLIIGAPNAGSGAGAAAVFELDERGDWVFEQVLTAPGSDPLAGFGWSVGISGNTAVIGTRAGNAAYVYRDTSGWALTNTLTPTSGQSSARFGSAVAIDGSAIAVGAPGEELLDSDPSVGSGAIYIFERAGNRWTLAEHVGAPASAVDSEFGNTVDVKASTIIVGAWSDDDMGQASGSVFALGRHGREWRIEEKIVPDHTAPGARFGADVSAGGSRAAVIALGGGGISSWAEILHRTGDRWSHEAELLPTSPSVDDPLYRSIDLEGTRVVVGSGIDRALVFRMSPGMADVWNLETILRPSEESGAADVGFDVAMHGGTVVLGGLLAPGLAESGAPVNVDAGAWLFRAASEDGDGAWSVRDLGALPGVGAPLGDIVTWTDVKDGWTYAAMATAEGVILFTRDTAGRWTFRNLTAEIPGAESIVGDVVAFGTRGNRVLLVGFGANGDMLLYRQPNTGTPGHWDWAFANLSERDLRPYGLETPHFVGSISAFSTRWNSLNIAGIDAAGRIQAVWIAPGMDHWQTSNLSVNAGAPRLTGRLAAFTTEWGAINLAGTNTRGELVVTWWVPGFSHWKVNNFTTGVGGPRLDPGSLTAFATPWGALNIVGRDDRGDAVAYWWSPGFARNHGEDRWRVADLADRVRESLPTRGPLHAVVEAGGGISLLGTTDTGAVIRYSWSEGETWRLDNLTAEAHPV
ncbi:MAG: FG-GAP repeat protein [Phycisphaerales bacterium]|nr:FG-GAP repeat protein [Phycisphaerales bacterium]